MVTRPDQDQAHTRYLRSVLASVVYIDFIPGFCHKHPPPHNTLSPLSLPSLPTPTTHLELRDTPYSIVETPEISHPLLNPSIQELQPTSLCLLESSRPLLPEQPNNTTQCILASTMEQQPQQPSGGALGPTGRRLHIAHRRSPSELTPLMSMFSNPGSELP